MKKVICIKEGNYDNRRGIVPRIYIGNTYTVIKQIQQKEGSVTLNLYLLEEIGEAYGYGVDNFASISNIDETEFERNYKKELV